VKIVLFKEIARDQKGSVENVEGLDEPKGHQVFVVRNKTGFAARPTFSHDLRLPIIIKCILKAKLY
jgi:hypothetical protein